MNKKSIILTFSGIIVIALMLSSGPVYAQDLEGKITIEGSNTVFPVIESAGARYQEINPDVTISASGPGSGAGFTALLNGQTDLAPMSRAPKATELADAEDEQLEIIITQVAIDAIVIVLNDANPINNLSHQNVSDIYGGNITNWSAFGWGAGGDITLLERDENSGTHDYFNEEFLDGAEVDPNDFTAHKQYTSTSALFTDVADTEGAIGYGGLAYFDGSVKAVDVNGVSPSKNTAKDGSYPVARPLFIVYDIRTVPTLAIDFLQYILSPEGQYIVEDVGYVSIYDAASELSEVEESPLSITSSIIALSFVGIIIYQIRKKRN